ncbi:MAG: hypothetical protein ACLR6W_01710 [Evtepia sp.]
MDHKLIRAIGSVTCVMLLVKVLAMIKKMATIRTANYTRIDRTAIGHAVEVRYIASITV